MSEPSAHISLEDLTTHQVIKPKTWTRLVVNGISAFSMIRGWVDIDLQLYADFGTSKATWPLTDRPKTWQTMIRRLDGTADGNVSSRQPIAVPPIYNFAVRYPVNAFYVEPGIPLTFDVWHDATRDVPLREVVLKIDVTRPA